VGLDLGTADPPWEPQNESAASTKANSYPVRQRQEPQRGAHRRRTVSEDGDLGFAPNGPGRTGRQIVIQEAVGEHPRSAGGRLSAPTLFMRTYIELFESRFLGFVPRYKSGGSLCFLQYFMTLAVQFMSL
jgi:hypothetical protein